MKRFQTSNGINAKVRIFHTTTEKEGEERRCTKVQLSVGRRTFKAVSVCNPSDNFSKKLGRRYAANKLLETCRKNAYLAENLTREDRRAIFMAVCPEFSRG